MHIANIENLSLKYSITSTALIFQCIVQIIADIRGLESDLIIISLSYSRVTLLSALINGNVSEIKKAKVC